MPESPRVVECSARFEPSFASALELSITLTGPSVLVTLTSAPPLVLSQQQGHHFTAAIAALRAWEPFEPTGAPGCDGITLRGLVRLADGRTQALESWSPTRTERPRTFDYFTTLLELASRLPLEDSVRQAVRGARDHFSTGLPVSVSAGVLRVHALVPDHMCDELVECLEAAQLRVIDLCAIDRLPVAALEALVRVAPGEATFCAAPPLSDELLSRGIDRQRIHGTFVDASNGRAHGGALVELKQRVVSRLRGLRGVIATRLQDGALVVVGDARNPAALAALREVLQRDFPAAPVRIEEEGPMTSSPPVIRRSP